MPPLRPEFRKLLEALDRQNVRFVVIGGVAMSLHGSAHVTLDIDLCYARDMDNLEAVAASLANHQPRLRGGPDELPFLWDVKTLRSGLNFTLRTSLCDVDFLGEVAGVHSFEGLWARSVEMDVDGLRIHVASLDDLIAMKRAANRPKDQAHLYELLALKKLLSLDQKP